MIYRKPQYYDLFQCTAGDCPSTCCAGWKIAIDQESLDKYGKLKGEFGYEVKNAVDWMEEEFLQQDGVCRLLTRDGLCSLQLHLGEEALCHTCRLYPRHEEEYEGVREWSLSMSCPAAARLILFQEKPMKLVEEKDREIEEFEEFDQELFHALTKVREILFQVLGSENMSLAEKVCRIWKIAKAAQNCLDQEKVQEMTKAVQGLEYDREIQVIEPGWEKIKENYKILTSLIPVEKEWDQMLGEVEKYLLSPGVEHYSKVAQRFFEYLCSDSYWAQRWEPIGERLLEYSIYLYLGGAVYDGEILSKAALSICSLWWAGQLCMLQWYKNNGCLESADVVEAVYRYAREVEHCDENLDLLEECLNT